jgi:hypothetical protein
MRGNFVACPYRFWRGSIQSLTKPGTNVHLHFGGCMAKGLEAMRKSFWGALEPEPMAFKRGCDAIIKAWGDYEPEIPTQKTLDAALDALASYMEQYPPEREVFTPLLVDGVPQVECTFAVPIPGLTHPEDNGPILWAGRYDMLAQSSEGGLYIEDDKTTSALGASWLKQWYLRGQFTGYAWAAREYGIPVTAVLVRGIGILKTQITHAQAIESRPNWLIDRWLSQLQRDVRRMIAAWLEGEWDQAYDHACSEFGGCTFLDLCTSPNPDNWLANFEVRPWNPLLKTGD